MVAADFCTVTPDVAAERAVASMVIAADSSLAAGSSPQRLDLVTRCDPIWDCHHPHAPHAVQISHGQERELSVHKRRIYRRLRTSGLCCHVPARLASLGLVCGLAATSLEYK